ncbi:hypothetical protein J2801_003590 [Paraburkholderia phenoliruptrix]|uniref:hypothetical protein n=1 Tax=Paraburkholderia phenoliruptrix TaxID=252970 RepID=UPI002863F340|nr:hypothetical protein [Paraburkholderia phenoliruptrix]MDR6421302.1 hypothetical protein [Paraburkholderia phenoliruptrix]
MNPNNCATCNHKQNPDGGHCYMFRDEPTDVCMQHTGRFLFDRLQDYLPMELIRHLAKDKP